MKHLFTKFEAAGDVASPDIARPLLDELSRNPTFIDGVAKQLVGAESVELVRNGFVLTAYVEERGQYRAPHDHGACWVVYMVLRGEMEMGSYVATPAGIDLRGVDHLREGEGRTYLAGDIHDTRCRSDRAIILRFTSCDLKGEERAGRMRRFAPSLSCALKVAR